MNRSVLVHPEAVLPFTQLFISALQFLLILSRAVVAVLTAVYTDKRPSAWLPRLGEQENCISSLQKEFYFTSYLKYAREVYPLGLISLRNEQVRKIH